MRGSDLLAAASSARASKRFRRIAWPAAEFLFGDAQQRSRMLGQRGENLLVDRARLGGRAAGFVPGCERKGVLDGGLHGRRRARAHRAGV